MKSRWIGSMSPLAVLALASCGAVDSPAVSGGATDGPAPRPTASTPLTPAAPNGVEQLDSKALLSRSFAVYTQDATSVHAVTSRPAATREQPAISVRVDRQKTVQTPPHCDARLDYGPGGKARFGMGSGQMWATLDDTYWKNTGNGPGERGTQAAGHFTGQAITAPYLSPDALSFRTLTGPCQTLAAFRNHDTDYPDITTFTKRTPITLNGTRVIPVDITGDLDKAGARTVYVALTGKPYPVRIDYQDGSRTDFTDYDQPVTVNPPPTTRSVDPRTVADFLGVPHNTLWIISSQNPPQPGQ
ncbi:hypothetical protein [Streptomyces sp. RKAG293]|uniref:hypothetical protein n=1 Tax=Streptomyces sp. RKAG293 TaxID=2893403 RepID=UPI002034086D|nr:hypothetical protein [Streptomyces sp. RKAG293]MCM2416863.1 hypothetical protein [Streptomyces sp. RKAG293]